MSQTRFFVTAPRAIAEDIYRRLETAFEDDGLPLAIIEVDEAAAIFEVSLYAEDAEDGRHCYSRAMPDSPAIPRSADLLSERDPPPVAVVHPAGAAPAVLICDHASNGVPAKLADLGLDDVTRSRHIAWDILLAAGDRSEPRP